MSATPWTHAALAQPHAAPDMDISRAVAEIGRLRAELAAQACLVRAQATSLSHSRKIFERASAVARIGVWECSLPDETLSWTDQVYDIFEISRGSVPDRSRVLKCYPG